MKIINIIQWLAIFIIGSLIVNFLISPGSYQSFKQNIKNIIPESISSFSFTNSEKSKENYFIYETGVQCLNFEGTFGYVCEGICDKGIAKGNKCRNNQMVCYCKK